VRTERLIPKLRVSFEFRTVQLASDADPREKDEDYERRLVVLTRLQLLGTIRVAKRSKRA
jgi:hypothetical protein